TNASNCSASNSTNVTINLLPATPTITAPTFVTANSTGNTASGPDGSSSYAWTITNGTITSAANIQTITFTAGASGQTTLSLTVTNASGCSANNSKNVPIDRVPVANADSYSVQQDTTLNPSAPGVLTNDSDADSDAITAVLVTGPTHASSFTLNANGSFTYTPITGYTGSDTFTYKANDGKADSTNATVTITINPNVTVSINDVSANEGNSGTTAFNFTVSLSQTSSQPVTVTYATANDTAIAGEDYVAVTN